MADLLPTELAWAAGFFDGEGSTSLMGRKRKSGERYRYLTVQVSQKDPRPLFRFMGAVGVGQVYGPYASQRDKYKFQATGPRAHIVIDLLWPYLSEPKREQATRAKEGERLAKPSPD